MKELNGIFNLKKRLLNLKFINLKNTQNEIHTMYHIGCVSHFRSGHLW